jgi:flagellin-like protein
MKKIQRGKSFISNKKGLSEIIGTLIVIALVLLAAGIVWGVVNNILKDKIKSSTSCFGNFGKITLDKKYTCYDTSANPGKVRFSLNRGDVNVDNVLISITNGAETKSFKVNNNAQAVDGLTYLNGTSIVSLPPKNGGITYAYLWTSDAPKTVQIAPMIDGQQCEVSDSITEIDNCNLLPA